MNCCLLCGGPLREFRENYIYNECGLDNVVLKDLERTECLECGDRQVLLPNCEGLHTLIARHLALKPVLLTGREIRFLRTYLRYSGADYARKVGVSPETVSRWENEKLEMGWANELVLRMSVLLSERLTSYEGPEFKRERKSHSFSNPLERFDKVNKEKGTRVPAPLQFDFGGSWRPMAAA